MQMSLGPRVSISQPLVLGRARFYFWVILAHENRRVECDAASQKKKAANVAFCAQIKGAALFDRFARRL